MSHNPPATIHETAFIHPNAIVEPGVQIGAGTRVWAFSHILPGAIIGEDCNICDHVFIEGDVVIGDRVTVKSGVQLWNGILLENDVFIGPNATFTNDIFPRSKQHQPEEARTVIRSGASIGANTTILASVSIGIRAMIGAGAVVTKNVPPHAIVVGNPARISGYVSSNWKEPIAQSNPDTIVTGIKVPAVSIHVLPQIIDMRGSLSFGEVDQHLPFTPKRYFIVFDVPSLEIRGEHAHKKLHQFLICVKGSCFLVVDDGYNRDEIILNRPNMGVHIPPMIWATQYKYTSDAVLLVLTSEIYDPDDYIRNYDNYLCLVNHDG